MPFLGPSPAALEIERAQAGDGHQHHQRPQPRAEAVADIAQDAEHPVAAEHADRGRDHHDAKALAGNSSGHVFRDRRHEHAAHAPCHQRSDHQEDEGRHGRAEACRYRDDRCRSHGAARDDRVPTLTSIADMAHDIGQAYADEVERREQPSNVAEREAERLLTDLRQPEPKRRDCAGRREIEKGRDQQQIELRRKRQGRIVAGL